MDAAKRLAREERLCDSSKMGKETISLYLHVPHNNNLEFMDISHKIARNCIGKKKITKNPLRVRDQDISLKILGGFMRVGVLLGSLVLHKNVKGDPPLSERKTKHRGQNPVYPHAFKG